MHILFEWYNNWRFRILLKLVASVDIAPKQACTWENICGRVAFATLGLTHDFDHKLVHIEWVLQRQWVGNVSQWQAGVQSNAHQYRDTTAPHL